MRIKSRATYKDLQLAWMAPDPEPFLAMVRGVSNATLKKAHRDLQVRDPKQATAMRAYLHKRGIDIYAKGGARGPALGTVKPYKVHTNKGHLCIRLPIGPTDAELGDVLWARFVDRRTVVCTTYDPREKNA